MSVNYRIDKVERLPEGQDYIVPCGMNTICYTAEASYNILRIIEKVKKCRPLKENEVYIHSKWNQDKRDFIIYAITDY